MWRLSWNCRTLCSNLRPRAVLLPQADLLAFGVKQQVYLYTPRSEEISSPGLLHFSWMFCRCCLVLWFLQTDLIWWARVLDAIWPSWGLTGGVFVYYLSLIKISSFRVMLQHRSVLYADRIHNIAHGKSYFQLFPLLEIWRDVLRSRQVCARNA